MSEKITKEMKIKEILEKKPEAAEILIQAGITCLGCPMAAMETLEQGLKAHGKTDEEIDDIIKKINQSS